MYLKTIYLYVFILSISIAFSYWEMTLEIEDVDGEAATDYIVLGVCETCHDGFHYGEDVYDLPNGFGNYTDIHFFNLSWDGQIDSNENLCCDNPKFHIDKKSIHPDSELLEWRIRGNVQGHNSDLKLTWTTEGELSDNYDIYLYIGNFSYNLRTEQNILLSPADLQAIYSEENPYGLDNIKILLGGCAATGTQPYYLDNDYDGWGSGPEYNFCPNLEPDGYVNNNLDTNDSIYCLSNSIDNCDVCDGNNNDMDCLGTCFGDAEYDCNGICDGDTIIDDCGVCDGNNNDMDCLGTCFGNAVIDDCGICNGNNQNQDDCGVCNGENLSCLDQVFYNLPANIYALIQDESVLISWNFEPLISSTIQGFNLYHGTDESNVVFFDTLPYLNQEYYYETSQFNDGVFCISIYDNYSNESNLTCTNATEYYLSTYNLHEGANLISFPFISPDNSIDFIFNSIENNVEGVIGESVASTYNPELNMWLGNLEHIEYSSGYWIKIISNSDVILNVLGFPPDENIYYDLNEGNNLKAAAVKTPKVVNKYSTECLISISFNL